MIALKNIMICSLIALMLTVASCREDDVIFIPEDVPVSTPEYTSVKGFYLLNEGNMGSNKCTLDYYDYSSGVYTRNVYGNANPTVPKELGDVGNDLAVYGSRLYAVVNVSNKVEVMNAATTERIGQIDIPNCRFIKFHKGYAYVTSYAGPVVIKPDYEQPWYTHDLSASYNFGWLGADMRLTAEVNNLLNQQYDVIRNYPMPGRNYKFILKIDL